MRRWSVVVMVALSSCGTEEVPPTSPTPGGTCPLYEVPSGIDLTQPVVSFKNEVMPIFNATCNSGSCHGSSLKPAGGVFLGSEAARGGDASSVRMGLVGAAAQEMPSMPLVTPGDPAKSFLMHKLDADQCAFAGQCTIGNCGALMPNGSSMPLPPTNRDQVRRWIAQGAKDN